MSGDSNYPNSILLVHGNGNNNGILFPESSVDQLTPTVFGNAITSTAQSKFNGSSIKCTAAGDYVGWKSPKGHYAAGDFTLEIQAYPTSIGGSAHKRYLQSSYSLIRENASNKLEFVIYKSVGSTTAFVAITSTTSPTLNTWQHLAVCRVGSTITLYKEGTGIATASYAGALFFCFENDYWYVGKTPTEGSLGYFAEINVINNYAKYTANFTPPAAPLIDYFGKITGSIIETLDIDAWVIVATCCSNHSMAGWSESSGSTYTVRTNTLEACNITLSPKIHYAWSANKAALLNEIVVSGNPDATPHLWKVTTAGTFAATEAAWNLSGTTTQGSAVLTYIAPLVDPITLGPKIPSAA